MIGLHLRLRDSLVSLADQAISLELPFFQCFLTLPYSGQIVDIPESEVQTFLTTYRDRFAQLFFHASYWSNLSSIHFTHHPVLRKELELAQRLEFTHIVVHPGSAKGGKEKKHGIQALAHALNKVLKHEHDIEFVLENTAHGKLSIGGDLHDFKNLLHLIDKPEKIKFCIDTAHAYSYGYDITSDEGQKAFVALIGTTLGFDRVVLLHLNDTLEKRASQNDKHAITGQGNIGEHALKRFMNHEKLSTIPVLLEPPVMNDEELKDLLNKVRGW